MGQGHNRRQVAHDSTLHIEEVNYPLEPVADLDFFLDAFSLATGVAAGNSWVPGDTADIFEQDAIAPGHSRNITITQTDAASTTLATTWRVDFEDQFGRLDFFEVSLAGTQTVVRSEQAHRIVKLTCLAIANNATSDLLDIGIGNEIGLPHKIKEVEQVTVTRTTVSVDTVLLQTIATVLPGTAARVDRRWSSIKAVGSGGSGVIVVGDSFFVRLHLDWESPDDRYSLVG